MRAVRFDGQRVAVVDLPGPSGDGVLVDVRAAGICGSDLALLAAGDLQWIPGHEIAGVTEQGDAVAIQPNWPCGACELCAQGKSHLCAQSMGCFLGVNNLDGGYAQQIRVDPSHLRPVPAGMDWALASMSEPFAVGLHAVMKLDPQPSEPVLVLGAGTIGLLSAALLVGRGHPVRLLARHPVQRSLAAEFGASPVTAEELVGSSYLHILDTTGSQSAIDAAYAAAAPSGRIVTVGCGGWSVPTSVLMLEKELTLEGSVIYTREEFEASIAWLDAHADQAGRLVTHRFPLKDAPEALRAAANKSASGCIKVVLEP